MILDFGDGFLLRQATTADDPALTMVCLRTGDAGRDATAREDDPELLGLIYALPYRALEPGFAFTVDGPNGVCGYLFGAPDTAAFNTRLAAEWYPELRRRCPDPGPDQNTWRGSDWARHIIHHPDLAVPTALEPYPSHGHIDLLPEAQGRGIGHRAMSHLEQCLRAAGSTGLFLQVDPRNRRATRFYRAIGYESLRSRSLPRHSRYMVKALV